MGRAWRIRWVAAVTLLRTVGHVLKNVDGPSDPLLGKIVEQAWCRLVVSKPEPVLFWQFIEEERNNILKEYRIRAGIDVTIRPGTAHWNLRTGEQRSDPGLPTLYSYTINSGPYKGRDQRDLLKDAIDWWESYLSEIEGQYRLEATS